MFMLSYGNITGRLGAQEKLWEHKALVCDFTRKVKVHTDWSQKCKFSLPNFLFSSNLYFLFIQQHITSVFTDIWHLKNTSFTHWLPELFAKNVYFEDLQAGYGSN